MECERCEILYKDVKMPYGNQSPGFRLLGLRNDSNESLLSITDSFPNTFLLQSFFLLHHLIYFSENMVKKK